MQRTRLQPSELKGCIEDYLRQRGLPLRKAFRCLSPDHEDRHPSMQYNPKARNVHCFSCGTTYDVFDLIGQDYGIADFGGRLRKACELFGYDSADFAPEPPARDKPVALPVVAVGHPPELDRGEQLAALRQDADDSLEYFHSRGLTVELCRKYGLFQQGGRAYFPVLENGVCTGWCARALDDERTPRYRNSTGAIGIWNGDLLAKNGDGKRLYVTEGIVDALCLEQMGEQAVALCGSQNVAKLLRRCQDNLTTANSWRFVACGDPDDAGHRMNDALLEGLTRLGLSGAVLELETSDGDVAALYRRDTRRLTRLLADLAAPAGVYTANSAAAAIDLFFEETARRAARSAASTGFAGLDKLLDGGLHSGLYVLGAISSLGKTSFLLQIADYIAENTADVLFFSLEQSRFELIAKSLSRTSARLDTPERRSAFTARQLLSGAPTVSPAQQRLLADTRETYSRAAAGLFLREGIADIGLDEIRAAIREHIDHRGRPPVVMVDYLQILRPVDPRSTDKQNTDRAVVELKRISRDFDVPVVAVSSFNRENYRAAVSMEAFKESGAVEYSADVLLGMQLQGAGGKDFDANTEKSREPRRVELVMLKNRNGIPYAKLNLHYHAKFSLFEECGWGAAPNPAGRRPDPLRGHGPLRTPL